MVLCFHTENVEISLLMKEWLGWVLQRYKAHATLSKTQITFTVDKSAVAH